MATKKIGKDRDGRIVEAEVDAAQGRVHISIDGTPAFDIYCSSSEYGILVRGVAGTGGDYDAIAVSPRASNCVVINGVSR